MAFVVIFPCSLAKDVCLMCIVCLYVQTVPQMYALAIYHSSSFAEQSTPSNVTFTQTFRTPFGFHQKAYRIIEAIQAQVGRKPKLQARPSVMTTVNRYRTQLQPKTQDAHFYIYEKYAV